MNSLELVRKLYEGEVDIDALDQEMRDELDHLIEAKDALSALPRKKPSADLIDAVVAGSRLPAASGGALTLILTNRFMQRLAAAAVVVVAVGVGYLTLTTDGLLPVDKQDVGALAPESASAVASREAEMKDEVSNEPVMEDSNVRSLGEDAKPSAPTRSLGKENAQMGAALAIEGLERRSRDDNMALPEEEMTPSDLAFAEIDSDIVMASTDSAENEESELLTWDQEEEALTTFFWQVQALDGRSPDDDWDEAVPLEGSFEQLEKQRPHGGRWLETGNQR